MTEKMAGYFLIIIGLLLILYPLFNVYLVFTNKAEPYELFSLTGITFDLTQMSDQPLTAEEKSMMGESGAGFELLSQDMINKPLNLISHVVLMGFIASIGFKLASLGTMLVRPINVRVKGSGIEKALENSKNSNQ
jgi:hypothetical protein